MTIKRLEFLLTETCNSECLHCQGEHSPDKQGVMEIEDGLNYLEETTSVTKLDSFMIFGGESMLYPQRAITLFQKAKALGIPKIELITNGSWGSDKRQFQELAIELKNAGVNEVSISVDAFHIQHIPLRFPRTAGLASLAAGIKLVVWNVTIVEDKNAKNQFDQETKKILRTLEPTGIEAHFNKIFPQGRARTSLRQFFPKQNLEGSCPQAEIALINPNCITMDPRGWASTCWSLSIGNAKKTPLSALITNYNWKNHPVTQTLVESGPEGLLKLPETSNFTFNPDIYIDKCHLCWDIRKFLKHKYPEMFVQE
jgi:molybdenum cofactor biosynthesis enzyme MoaA